MAATDIDGIRDWNIERVIAEAIRDEIYGRRLLKALEEHLAEIDAREVRQNAEIGNKGDDNG